MPEVNQLWGGTLTGLSVDPTARTVSAAITVEGYGSQQSYQLRLIEVRELRIERPDTDWDYTEVTELHSSTAGDFTHIEMVFWVEPNGLIAICEDFVVDQL